jgi:hypothetical protein
MSLRVLSGRMRQSAFTETSKDGFLLERTREDRIEGRYIEKVKYEEIFSDPFGRELKFDRVSYHQVQFTIYRDFPQLELRDAPRSLQSFIAKMLAITDFAMTAAPVTVEVMTWASALRDLVDAEMILDTVQLSEVAISPDTVGTVLLKGKRDVRKAMKELVAGRTHRVDKAGVFWKNERETVKVGLTSAGSVKVDRLDDDLLAILRKSFPKP